MKKKILIVCLILSLGTALSYYLSYAGRFVGPEEKQCVGEITMVDGREILTIEDQNEKRHRSQNVYQYTCDRESDMLYCRVNAKLNLGELIIAFYDGDLKLCSQGYVSIDEEKKFKNSSYSFGNIGGFHIGDKIIIKVSDSAVSSEYKLEVSQEKIL